MLTPNIFNQNNNYLVAKNYWIQLIIAALSVYIIVAIGFVLYRIFFIFNR